MFLGFSTDGFSAYLRQMQLAMSIPTQTSNCPEPFQWFFFGDFHTKYLCIQDAVHMGVKGHRAFINKPLFIGNLIASKAILLKLVANSPRAFTGLTAADLDRDKDKMNFGIVEKVCSDKVINCLKNEEERAVKAYLTFIRHIMTAYIENNVEPNVRIHSAWYTAWFSRLWKISILQGQRKAKIQKREGQDNVFEPSLQNSFISTNLHVCLEINGHGILQLLIRCREMGKPELFLVDLTGSQDCENHFRALRSMSTAFNTVVNVDVKEALERAKRMQATLEIMKTVEDFEFARNVRPKKSFIPTELPSNDQIVEIIRSGWEDVKKLFEEDLGNAIVIL